jgi:hypothetical protein
MSANIIIIVIVIIIIVKFYKWFMVPRFIFVYVHVCVLYVHFFVSILTLG